MLRTRGRAAHCVGRCLPAILGLIVAATAACSNAEGVPSSPRHGAPGGAGGEPAVPTSLEFDPSAALKLAPSESHELRVIAQPPGVYHVDFALLGDPADASLDRSEADTDAFGRASVVLTASTSSTLFTVRASVGTAISAQAAVAVSSSGFGSIQVEPVYTGVRSVAYWVASARTGATCADLIGNPPPDGDLIAQALVNQSPRIDGVPVGRTIAVTLRAAWFAGGCVDVPAIEVDTTTQVSVTVIDRPLQLDETDLNVTLGIDKPSLEVDLIVSAIVAQADQAFLDGATNDITALLDEMAAVSNDLDFSRAREQLAWDVLLGTALGAVSSPLTSRVGKWMKLGALELIAPDTVRGRLRAAGTEPGYADLEISAIAGLDPSLLDAPSSHLVTWTAEADDTVALGITSATQPFWITLSTLFGELATQPALSDAPTATDVPSALSDVLSCDAVGQKLAGSGEAYLGCNAQCVSALCAQALERMWQRARDVSATSFDLAKLEMTATGRATVDDYAKPKGFSGSWVGTLEHGSVTAPLAGPAKGSLPPPPN